MGKLGVAGLAVAVVGIAVLLPASEAQAQDFGQAWIDRITHELEQERGPLSSKPLTWSASAGIDYVYDNNVFLAPSGPGKKKDSILIPFVEAKLNYSEPRFDVEADFLGDYKRYFKQHASDDEERLYLRGRQTSARWNFEIAEIFQQVSDPTGVQFLNRVSRIISNTVPKAAFDIGKLFAIEVGGNIQVVRFKDGAFVSQENNNFSTDVTFVYRSPWAFDALFQFGYYNINYTASQSQGAPPDVFGYYYKVGFRGHLIERLHLEALAGYSNAETDFFASTGNDINEGTAVGNVNFRYEASDKITVYLDGSRMYTFEGFTDPFQLIDAVAIIGQFEFSDKFSARIRASWEHAHTALNVHRTWYGGSVGATYKVTPYLAVDAGVTYRSGKYGSTAGGSDLKFNDVIGTIGVAFIW